MTSPVSQTKQNPKIIQNLPLLPLPKIKLSPSASLLLQTLHLHLKQNKAKLFKSPGNDSPPPAPYPIFHCCILF